VLLLALLVEVKSPLFVGADALVEDTIASGGASVTDGGGVTLTIAEESNAARFLCLLRLLELLREIRPWRLHVRDTSFRTLLLTSTAIVAMTRATRAVHARITKAL